MKIEKISDNQIRCTLTPADLEERQLKLSELAYGTEKAKSLFHDMMQQAAQDFGFEANDMPLMIEAIPTSPDSIVLIITKVENPEELDTRFAKFSPSPQDKNSERKTSSPFDRLKKLEGADEFLNLLRQVHDAVAGDTVTETAPMSESTVTEPEEKAPSVRLFSFSTLDSVIRASKLLVNMYEGSNTLYKDEASEVYILVLTQSTHTASDFNRICNMLSEYGLPEQGDNATLAYLEEHCEVIIAKNAIHILGNL